MYLHVGIRGGSGGGGHLGIQNTRLSQHLSSTEHPHRRLPFPHTQHVVGVREASVPPSLLDLSILRHEGAQRDFLISQRTELLLEMRVAAGGDALFFVEAADGVAGGKGGVVDSGGGLGSVHTPGGDRGLGLWVLLR